MSVHGPVHVALCMALRMACCPGSDQPACTCTRVCTPGMGVVRCWVAAGVPHTLRVQSLGWSTWCCAGAKHPTCAARLPWGLGWVGLRPRVARGGVLGEGCTDECGTAHLPVACAHGLCRQCVAPSFSCLLSAGLLSSGLGPAFCWAHVLRRRGRSCVLGCGQRDCARSFPAYGAVNFHV